MTYKTMKICLINNLYKPYSRGGAEIVVEILAEGLRKNGHKVFIITTRPYRGRKKDEEKKNSGQIFYLPSLYYNLNRLLTFLRFFWHISDVFNRRLCFRVRKILQEEKPDIIMTHNLKGLGYLIPRAIKKSGIKWIHTIHDVQLVEPSGVIIRGKNPPYPSLSRGLYEKICRWLFGSPAVVISPSRWLLDFYSERGFFVKSKKVVMPNPVISHQPSVINHQLGGKTVNFLYLGQIEEHKGILFLINTFKEFLNCQLLIAGDGSRLDEIKKAAQDEPRIKILGRVPHEKIVEFFSQVDFTIVPSLCYENSPTVIYESLSFGVPVIAAKIGGVAELVKDRVNGFTFEAGDKEDLSRVLKYCEESKDKLEQMRREAIKSVEDFGVNNYILKLKSLI